MLWACRPESWSGILEKDWIMESNLKNCLLLGAQINQHVFCWCFVLHHRFYILASTPGKQIRDNQNSIILKDNQNRVHSYNTEWVVSVRNVTKLKEERTN